MEITDQSLGIFFDFRTSMDEAQLTEIIRLAMLRMQDELSFSSDKIQEITGQYVNETPQLLSSLKNKIENKHWDEVASAIHKLKARYSYFGFDEIEKELSSWEVAIREGRSINNLIEKLNQIDQLTANIVDALKITDYYKPIVLDESPTVSSSNVEKRILIVEDDDVNATILESFVRVWGGIPIRACDGFEAISKTVKERPNLIIMDVHMPFLGGLDAIRAIRGKGIKTTIISMSASYRLSEKEETINAGGNDFLTKPLNVESVERMLDKYLEPLSK